MKAIRHLRVLFAFGILSLVIPVHAFPFASPSLPVGMVSFTFDDGRDGQRTIAADLLGSYSIQATAFDYVSSLAKGRGFMTLTQLRELKDVYGWEIGDHTYTHPNLDSMTGQQLQQEIVGSKTEFTKLGFDVTTFAYPFSHGQGNGAVTRLIRQNYLGARSAATSQRAYLYDGSSDVYNIVANNVANTIAPGTVEGWIDRAVSQRKLLVLLFHQIVEDNASFDTFYLAADLSVIVSYVHEKIVQGVLEAASFRQSIETLSKAGTTNVASLVPMEGLFFGIIGIVVGGLVSVMMLRIRTTPKRRLPSDGHIHCQSHNTIMIARAG